MQIRSVVQTHDLHRMVFRGKMAIDEVIDSTADDAPGEERSLDEMYAIRDRLQDSSLRAGKTLLECRYAVRPTERAEAARA